MKITAPWLTHPATTAVCEMMTQSGYQALFVGGCVRNALLGQAVTDLDIATDATPTQVLALAKSAGLRAIPTGVEHGTVTVVSQGIPHEITTFRRDVKPDGRRAIVSFSTSIKDDAQRRDFTMNALYARPDGTIVDPIGGLGDLKNRRFRFIGDPHARIREDYLRILRFFRFNAVYADPEMGWDSQALSAIADNLEGLGQLSRERVGQEMIKLLSADNPAPALAAMRQTGVLPKILPGSDDRNCAILIHFESQNHIQPDPMRRLALLGGDITQDSLRLTNEHMRHLTLLRDHLGAMTSVAEIAFRHGADTAWDVALIRAALFEMPMPPETRDDITKGAQAIFPITSQDLMPEFQGRALGQMLDALKQDWISSNFTKTKSDLIAFAKIDRSDRAP